jgi:hypothetical protein
MDDLISRQAAIDAMSVVNDSICGQQAIDALCELPSAEPRWIPVTERLPEELSEVNITWTNTEPPSYYDYIKDKPFSGTGVYYKGRWYWYSAVCVDYLREYGFSPNDEMDDAINVVAWMPLPGPYAERR